MTPAERNLHDIAEAFCTPRVVREPCVQCGGSGRVAASTYSQPQMHTERCTACAGTGTVSRECAP